MSLKRVPMFIAFTFISLAGLSCGADKGSDANSDDEKVDSLPEGAGQLATGGVHTLPAVTDPVSLNADPSSDVEEFDEGSGTLEIDTSLLAENGIPLDERSTDDDFNGKSYAACEMVNRARGFFHLAAAPDSTECELKLLIGDSDTFYDNKFHIVRFVEEGEDSETFRFKIHGSKDNVTGFTFQVCEGDTQAMYLTKSIKDNAAEIYIKRYSEPDNPEVDKFWAITEVEGSVDSDGKFNSLKTIITTSSNLFSNGSRNVAREKTIQSSKNIQYMAYIDESSERNNRFAAYLNLIDKNGSDPYNLSLLELGEGAMLYKNGDDDAAIQGWNSDGSVANDNDIVSRFMGLGDELPEKPTETSNLKFEGDEVLDCASEAELTIDILEFEKAVAESLSLEDEEEEEADFCRDRYELIQDAHLNCRNSTSDSSVTP